MNFDGLSVSNTQVAVSEKSHPPRINMSQSSQNHQASQRSKSSFQTYRTDDTNASCLFTSQLQRKLNFDKRNVKRSYSAYQTQSTAAQEYEETEGPKRQIGPKAQKKFKKTCTELKIKDRVHIWQRLNISQTRRQL